MKSLDQKLGRIRAGSYTPRDFIIADAKDGDMGGGCTAPGPRRDGGGELTAYDPSRLMVGILGGGRGTTHDTFELASQAERAGAQVALFGRKINFSESPVDLVRHMRLVIEGELKGAEAVKAYHDALAKKKIRPDRDLKSALAITEPVLEA